MSRINGTSATIPSQRELASRVGHGALAGLGGGIIFGIMMAMMGVLTTIASLVGSHNPVVGAVLHLILSTIFGMAFGAVLGTARVWQLLGAGVVYGLLLWIIGGMLLLPAGAGMPVFQMGMFAMQKLVGHLVFGIVTALVLWGFRRRATSH